MAIDPRIVRVGITINGQLRTFDNVAITAQGSKYASATQNETIIKIANLDQETRDFLATEGTPFNRIRNRRRQRVFIEAGRVSAGVSRIFVGDITTVALSQPPDIWTTIRAITSQFNKGKVVSVSQSPISNLSLISSQAASTLGLSLKFETDDKQIANFGFTGAATKLIDKISELAQRDVYIDDEELIVKNKNAPIRGGVRLISAETGMIGTPELTDFGVKVKFLFDNQVKVGDQIEIDSKFYPAANGRYIIYKLDFDIANRDLPFYLIAETRRPGGVFNG